MAVTALCAFACSTKTPTPDASLTESTPTEAERVQTQIDTFVDGLDVKPGALVFTSRMNFDGVAPLELVVEERCAPHHCSFDAFTHAEEQAESFTRFRIFDVADPGAPVALGEPILAGRAASLHVTWPRADEPQLLVREQRTTAESPRGTREEQVRFRFVDTNGGTSVVEDAWCGLLDSYQPESLPVFTDFDGDGADELFVVASMPGARMFGLADLRNPGVVRAACMDVDDADGLAEAEAVAAEANIAAAYERLRADGATDPLRLASVLAVGALLQVERPADVGSLDGIMETFDRRAAAGRTLFELDAWRGGAPMGSMPFGPRERWLCTQDGPETTSAGTCYQVRADELTGRYPLADAVEQMLLLLALRAPDQPEVAQWAFAASSRASNPVDVRALAQLSVWAAPPDQRKEWAETKAAAAIETIAAGTVPLAGALDPARPALSDEGRAIYQLHGLYVDGFEHNAYISRTPYRDPVAPSMVYWDATRAFERLVDARWPDTTRLEKLLDYPALWPPLAAALLKKDPTTFPASLAERLARPHRYRDLDEGTEGNQDATNAVRRFVETQLSDPASFEVLLQLAMGCTQTKAVGCDETMTAIRRAHTTDVDPGFGMRLVIMVGEAWPTIPADVRTWWLDTVNDDARLETGRQVSSQWTRWEAEPETRFDVLLDTVVAFEDARIAAWLLEAATDRLDEVDVTAEAAARLDAELVRVLGRAGELTPANIATLLDLTTRYDASSKELRALVKGLTDDPNRMIADAAKRALAELGR